MALGDCLQQSREMHVEAGRVRNWRRTGEITCEFDIVGKFFGHFSPNISFAAESFHVFGRELNGFH